MNQNRFITNYEVYNGLKDIANNMVYLLICKIIEKYK